MVLLAISISELFVYFEIFTESSILTTYIILLSSVKISLIVPGIHSSFSLFTSFILDIFISTFVFFLYSFSILSFVGKNFEMFSYAIAK